MALYGKPKKEGRYPLSLPITTKRKAEELSVIHHRSLNEELVYLIELGIDEDARRAKILEERHE